MGPNIDILKNPTDLWGTVMGALLACYKGVDLEGEFQSAHRAGGGIADYAAATRDFIQAERDCDVAFSLLSPSLGAEQHLRAEQMERLEELKRANELKIAELEQRSQDATRAALEAQVKVTETLRQISEDHLAFVREGAQKDDRIQGQFLRLTRVSIALAALSVLQVFQLMWPNGIGPLVDRAPWQPRTTASGSPTPQSTPNTSSAQP